MTIISIYFVQFSWFNSCYWKPTGISFLFFHAPRRVAYAEYREQTGYPMTFLPLSCLPSRQAKWTLISFCMISICSWCALSSICLLLASTQCFLEHPSPFSNSWSVGLVWGECDDNQCKAVPGRVAPKLQRGICCDHWGPGDLPQFVKIYSTIMIR